MNDRISAAIIGAVLFFVDMQRANPSDLQERKLFNKEEIHIKDLLHLCIQDD
jgi:hypothetical protein